MVCSDGSGGAFVAWTDYTNSPVTQSDVYLQRITASGDVAAGWPMSGLAVCALPDGQFCQDLAPDGAGGALVVWYDWRDQAQTRQDIYAQRVLADGSLAPGWLALGTPVTRAPSNSDVPVIDSDRAGGAWIVWEDYDPSAPTRSILFSQHLLADGSVAPGWPQNGRAVVPDTIERLLPRIVSDGPSGFFVTWSQESAEGPWPDYPGDAYALRVTTTGDPAPGWPATGLRVFDDFVPADVASDMLGGIYFAARSFFGSSFEEKDYRIQRLASDGQLAPGWQAEGLLIATGNEARFGLTAASDESGGVLLTWYDYRLPGPGSDVYASRALPGGVLAPGWPDNGLRVSDPAQPIETMQSIVPDQTGGAYIAWEQETSAARPARIQHVTGSALIAPGWPDTGLRAHPTAKGQLTPRLASDGSGGAIVVWMEAGGCCDRIGLFAQKFVTDGILATALSLVSAAATPEHVELLWSGVGAGELAASVERRTERTTWQTIGAAEPDGPDRLRCEDRSVEPGARYAYRLSYREDGVQRVTSESWVEVPRVLELALEGFRPNPATGPPIVTFTLPSATSASLELLDVSGRRVASRDLSGFGPGRHMMRLEDLRTPPGIYWIRLRHGESVRLRRGVVAR